MNSPTTKTSRKIGQPSILLAFDWFDHRIYAGIARFALEADWHLSPYLFCDRSLPYNWPGHGAITSYGPTLGKFIETLEMPRVDVTVAKIPQPIPRVVVNNEAIGSLAARHFLKRGFQHFAYYHWPTVEVNDLRHRYFRTALTQAGVPEERIHTLKQSGPKQIGDWKLHEQSILTQLVRMPRPLAVFTGQDNLGATLIEICHKNGIHVPEEVAVLGVDNLEFLCDCLAVPMSSIDTRLAELGYQAARQLQRRLDNEIGDDEPPLLIDPGKVVRRRSTEVLAVPHTGVAGALRIMHAEFGKPLTIEDICAQLSMSKRGMEKAFRQFLRRSPADELRRIRIDHAKRLLTETDLKIEAIARDCGYCNSSNLSLAFRRDADMTPRVYRRKFGSQPGQG